MPLKKVEKGNMYDWVDLLHNHLEGECEHKCKYCYVQKNRFGIHPKYKGNLRLNENELNENYYKYGIGKAIFIEYMNDLFQANISYVFIDRILEHCKKYPENLYIIQTKNAELAFHFWELGYFPKNFMIGTTIETNRLLQDDKITKAPDPYFRYMAMLKFPKNIKIFLTLEPIMDFDVDILSKWIIEIQPNFINIGADSKHCNLQEPSKEKILKLIEILKENNIEIRQKSNLARLLK